MNDQTSALSAPVVSTPVAKQSTRGNRSNEPRARGNHYDLASHVVVAILLPPGQSIYLTHNLVPRTDMLSAGLNEADGGDFIFTPAHRGRTGDRVNASKDISMAARLTAMPDKPLLLALHDPWPDFRGGVSIGHIRLARETRCSFDIAENSWATSFVDGMRIRLSCKEAAKKEHICIGGPKGAVVYEDEKIVPGFYFREGECDSLPFTYIVDDQEMAILEQTFRDGARAHHAAREGRKVEIRNMPVGALRRVAMGEMELSIDAVGMVFGLQFKGEPVARVPLANNVTVYDGKLVENPRLREAFGLRPLGTAGNLLQQVKPSRSAALNSLDAAFAHIEADNRAKATPVAARRSTAPKLSDVAPASDEPQETPAAPQPVETPEVITPEHPPAPEIETPAPAETPPAETPVEVPAEVIIPTEDTPEVGEPAVEEVVDTPPVEEVIPPVETTEPPVETPEVQPEPQVETPPAVTPVEVPAEVITPTEDTPEVGEPAVEEVVDTPPVEEVIPPVETTEPPVVTPEVQPEPQVETPQPAETPEVVPAEAPTVEESLLPQEYIDVVSPLQPHTELQVAPAPAAPQDCRAELMMETWGNKPTPTILLTSGMPVCIVGNTLTAHMAQEVFDNIEILLPIPGCDDFLTEVYAIQEMSDADSAAA